MIYSSTMLFQNKIFDSNFKKKSRFFKQNVRKLLFPNKFLIKKYKLENPIKIFDKSGLIKSELKNIPFVLSCGTFLIFFGFFSATSAITIIGSVADWDPLAAAVMLCWVEFINKIFYKHDKNSLFLKFMNTFKIGINLGIFVDAFKLTG